MTEKPSDMRTGIWQVPECPFLIEYSPALLDEIRLAVLDAFFSLPRGGAEIGGVLFGNRDDERVRITAFRPMDCEHATGPSFALSGKDQARLRAQLEEFRRDPLLRDLEVMGWYHSHTRSDIFLSQLDLNIYDQFFPRPWQVALVMRPTGMKPTRAGFFFREGDGEIHSSASYHEFSVGGEAGAHGSGNGRPAMAQPAPGMAARTPMPNPSVDPLQTVSNGDSASWADSLQTTSNGDSVARVDELPGEQSELSLPAASLALQRLEAVPARRKVDVGPAIEMRPTEFVPPAFLIPPERRRPRARTWLALVLLAGTGATAYFTSGYWMKALSAKPAYLHLRAFDREGQFRIQWDPAPLTSTNVQGGSLEIVDGAYATTIPLDRVGLRAGSFQYVRRTENVEAHLTVRMWQGSPLEEFTTFYGQPPKPANSPEQEKQLAAEAERARVDLKKEELRRLELERSLDQMRRQMHRDEERKRVENQMPSAVAPRPADPQPPAKSAVPQMQTANNVNPALRSLPPASGALTTAPSASNAAPQGKPQGVAQGLAPQAIASPAREPDKPPATVELPAPPPVTAPPATRPPVTLQPPARPPVSPPQPESKPVTAAPKPAQSALSGRWVYSPATKSGSPFPPESVNLVMTEANNQVRGILDGRYKVPKGQKMNPRVNLNFEGPVHAGSSKFTFTAADGLKGEIELIRLPGKQDAIEVVWYSERDKLTFDDIFFRLP
jgi:proteasome lid subunit RPN8/RPN11